MHALHAYVLYTSVLHTHTLAYISYFHFFCTHLFRTHIFYEHVVEGTIASKLSLVPGFQLPPAGSYIAIRGLKEGRWLKIEGCQVGHSWGGNDNLADEARAERFKLVVSWKHL